MLLHRLQNTMKQQGSDIRVEARIRSRTRLVRAYAAYLLMLTVMQCFAQIMAKLGQQQERLGSKEPAQNWRQPRPREGAYGYATSSWRLRPLRLELLAGAGVGSQLWSHKIDVIKSLTLQQQCSVQQDLILTNNQDFMKAVTLNALNTGSRTS